jgi:hypothetical protein
MAYVKSQFVQVFGVFGHGDSMLSLLLGMAYVILLASSHCLGLDCPRLLSLPWLPSGLGNNPLPLREPWPGLGLECALLLWLGYIELPPNGA